ncbi:MAG TPA: penicillin-binding protein [Terriglobales bacterium]|nr:penicillin-binding protein [Terriglobales bacterium]
MAAGSTSLHDGASRRLYFLGSALLLWLMLVVLRLVQLQVVQYGEFVQRAQHQQQRTVELSPRRGIIYDRNGHELAMSVNVDSVFAVPSEIPDQAMTARLLARVLKLDPDELLDRFKSSHSFAWVARKLDPEVSDRIHALNLRGIYFTPEPKRYYPKGEMASQILGYVGLDDEGLGGIEHAFDGQLRGRPGTMVVSMDARRRKFGRVERQPEAGENVVLTIDEKIQYIAERELDAAMAETRAETGTVIVENPHTGEILALANRPTFNPNVRKVAPSALKNHAVSDVYEPGSVFKLVTISAALEEKLTNPDEVIDCQMGSIIVGGMRIRDHERLGLLTVSQILAKSSDVGAIKLGMRLGEDRFDRYIRAYGFGSQTGIELPGETRGLAKPVSRWSKVSIGAISMGQEIGVTPLQIISVASTIANDGVYVPPRIVAGDTKPNSGPTMIAYHPPLRRRVISPLTAVQMKKMMEGVVLFGTGRKAILDGYTSAGKTGTAQKVDPATGAYSRSRYVASFAGFAPVNNPAISIIVVLDSAQGLHQGGQVSAPVFARVAQQVLAYLHVSHDAEIKNNVQRLQLRAAVKDDDLSEGSQDRLGEPIHLAQEKPAAAPAAEPIPAGDLKVVPAALRAGSPSAAPADDKPEPTSPLPAAPVLPASGTVVLDVEGGPVVPSFLGKSLRSVIETAENAGIDVDVIGTGTAREQVPPPGSHLPAGGRVEVKLSR